MTNEDVRLTYECGGNSAQWPSEKTEHVKYKILGSVVVGFWYWDHWEYVSDSRSRAAIVDFM